MATVPTKAREVQPAQRRSAMARPRVGLGSAELRRAEDVIELQRAVGNTAVSTLLASDAGQPLDPTTRSAMENGFGESLASVRVHTSGAAAESARALGAAAYTAGSDVVFDAGQYRPFEDIGRFVLAHELAHVIQQRRSQARVNRGAVGHSGDVFERTADRAAAAVSSGEPAAVGPSGAAPGVQCLKKADLENRVREVIHNAKGESKAVVVWLEHSKISNATHRLQVDKTDGDVTRALASALDRLQTLWPPSNWRGGQLAVAFSHPCNDCDETLDEIARKYAVAVESYVFQISSAKGAATGAPRSRRRLAGGTLEKPPAKLPPAPYRFEPSASSGRRPSESLIEFELDPSARPGELGFTASAPSHSDDWIEHQLRAVQWEITNGGFYLYCSGPSLPLFLPPEYTDWTLTKAQSIGEEIYLNKSDADAAVKAAGGTSGGITRFAYYRVGKTGIIVPTVFSPATTPHVIALMRELLQWISGAMVETMRVTAYSIVGGMVVRGVANVMGRLFARAPVPPRLQVPEEGPQPPSAPKITPGDLPSKPANENAEPGREPSSKVVRIDEWLEQKKAAQQPTPQRRMAAGAEHETPEPTVASGRRGGGGAAPPGPRVAEMSPGAGRVEEPPVRVGKGVRGLNIEDDHLASLGKYDKLPPAFKGIDGVAGEFRVSMEKGKPIRVYSRPDAVSVKSTDIIDAGALQQKIRNDLKPLRGQFNEQRAGVRVEGLGKRELHLLFEEGRSGYIGKDTLAMLKGMEKEAGSVKFRWYVYVQGQKISGPKFFRQFKAFLDVL